MDTVVAGCLPRAFSLRRGLEAPSNVVVVDEAWGVSSSSSDTPSSSSSSSSPIANLSFSGTSPNDDCLVLVAGGGPRTLSNDAGRDPDNGLCRLNVSSPRSFRCWARRSNSARAPSISIPCIDWSRFLLATSTSMKRRFSGRRAASSQPTVYVPHRRSAISTKKSSTLTCSTCQTDSNKGSHLDETEPCCFGDDNKDRHHNSTSPNPLKPQVSYRVPNTQQQRSK